MLHGVIVKLIDAGFFRVRVQGVKKKKKKTNSCGKKMGVGWGEDVWLLTVT